MWDDKTIFQGQGQSCLQVVRLNTSPVQARKETKTERAAAGIAQKVLCKAHRRILQDQCPGLIFFYSKTQTFQRNEINRND